MDSEGPKNLKRLWEMLPSLTRGLSSGKVGGKGRCPVRMAPLKGNLMPCDICGTQFRTEEDPVPGLRFCRKCKDLLAEDYTAVICPETGEFSFIKSEALKDMAGGLMRVSPPVMAMIVQKFEKQKKQKDADGKEDQLS